MRTQRRHFVVSFVAANVGSVGNESYANVQGLQLRTLRGCRVPPPFLRDFLGDLEGGRG